MDVSGKIIFKAENISSKEISVNLSEFAEGIYFVQMVNVKGEIYVHKVITH